MLARLRLPLAVFAIGIVNALLFKAFEFIVDEGTQWLWNDLLHTDTHRWLVIPLAALLSVALSFLVIRLGQKRVVPPKTDLLAEDGPGPVPSLRALGIVLLIGAVSLLAGASLGPEASLTASSLIIGAYMAVRLKAGKAGALLELASMGALLVAFFGSPIPVLLPGLVLYKKTKQLAWRAWIVFGLAAAASYVTIRLIDSANPGYGKIPVIPKENANDYLAAFVVGLLTAFAAIVLKKLILRLAPAAEALSGRMSWWWSAMIIGAVLGVLYFVGGESVQFSGSAGTDLLVHHMPEYGILALLGLAVAKLSATSWSMASGYRGGLVFPSVYSGVAISLFLSEAFPNLAGAGAMVGGVAGMFAAILGSPVIAFIFVLSMLPFNLLGVAVVAIIGATIGNSLQSNFARSRSA